MCWELESPQEKESVGLPVNTILLTSPPSHCILIVFALLYIGKLWGVRDHSSPGPFHSPPPPEIPPVHQMPSPPSEPTECLQMEHTPRPPPPTFYIHRTLLYLVHSACLESVD